MVNPVPDKHIVRLYALLWTVGYLAVYFVFRNLLPEKALTDAAYIQEVIQGVAHDAPSQGYAIMAMLFGLLPDSVANALVGIFDAFILYTIIMHTRTFRGMAILPIILVPFIALNLQAPTKETLVLVMTLAVLRISERVKNENKLFALIVVLYVLYGAMVRDYYLLIAGAFVGLVAMRKSPVLLRFAFVVPVLVVLLLMPKEGYMLLGNARNEVNFHVEGGSDVRTYFLNPFPSDNMMHFLGNYGYAFAVLNFPFLKSATVKEVVLFANILIYGCLMVVGLAKLKGPQSLLPVLFLAHIAVLTIFEPDFGSYFRHFSSILLYLVPSFVWLETQKAAHLQGRLNAA